jgi:acetaldehyde dehydrogenase (acetylating)
MIVDRFILEQATEEAKKNGCYFVNEAEKKKLENTVLRDGRINPDIVGKPAAYIADSAGFSVSNNIKVLVANCDTVGKSEPLSIEKLSPVLAFYTVDGWLEGCHKCIELLEFGGLGHTMVIHSNDKEVILKFALEKPAFRILVNTPASVGAVGYTTALNPSMTLGVGTWGGSIISENVTAKHLMNIKTLAFETNPMNQGKSVSSLDESVQYSGSVSNSTSDGTFIGKIEERLRARAGNPKLEESSYTKTNFASDTEKIYGESISRSEIDEILSRFKS